MFDPANSDLNKLDINVTECGRDLKVIYDLCTLDQERVGKVSDDMSVIIEKARSTLVCLSSSNKLIGKAFRMDTQVQGSITLFVGVKSNYGLIRQ